MNSTPHPSPAIAVTVEEHLAALLDQGEDAVIRAVIRDPDLAVGLTRVAKIVATRVAVGGVPGPDPLAAALCDLAPALDPTHSAPGPSTGVHREENAA